MKHIINDTVKETLVVHILYKLLRKSHNDITPNLKWPKSMQTKIDLADFKLPVLLAFKLTF